MQCWKDGARYPDGDYFTDDLADAKATKAELEAQAKRQETKAE